MLNVGVRFCGGCNSRYDRGEAFKDLESSLKDTAKFSHAEEGKEYDLLLVIGGCTNCCASYNQSQTKRGVLKMWELEQLSSIEHAIRDLD